MNINVDLIFVMNGSKTMSEKEYKDKCESMFKKNTILLNENEQLKQQLKEIIGILWWESHTDDDKLRNIWKVLFPDEKYMRD